MGGDVAARRARACCAARASTARSRRRSAGAMRSSRGISRAPIRTSADQVVAVPPAARRYASRQPVRCRPGTSARRADRAPSIRARSSASPGPKRRAAARPPPPPARPRRDAPQAGRRSPRGRSSRRMRVVGDALQLQPHGLGIDPGHHAHRRRADSAGAARRRARGAERERGVETGGARLVVLSTCT